MYWDPTLAVNSIIQPWASGKYWPGGSGPGTNIFDVSNGHYSISGQSS